VKGIRRRCISNAVDGTDDDMLWNGSEEDGRVRSECEKWRLTLIGKGRENVTCFVYSVYEMNSKVLFLSRHCIFFWGGST
jgi:hypothetical protein